MTATTTDLIATVSSVLTQQPEVAAAYLYGSAAAGRATALSDVDVAVIPCADLASERRGALLRELTVALERSYSGARFDVRFLDELPLSIAGRVVTEGRRVSDRDPARRVAAEVRTRMAYHDFLIFEREGMRAALKGLRRAVRHG
jgi:uncharacterized protein